MKIMSHNQLNRLRGVWLLTWLSLCKACAPAVATPCSPEPRIEDGGSVQNETIAITELLDEAGETYQTMRVVVTTPNTQIHTTENVSASEPYETLQLVINGRRQPIFVWNGRAAGAWRIMPTTAAVEASCNGDTYEVIIGTTPHGPCPEIVCRGIQDTDVIQMRFDVCDYRTGVCVPGVTRQLTVRTSRGY